MIKQSSLNLEFETDYCAKNKTDTKHNNNIIKNVERDILTTPGE